MSILKLRSGSNALGMLRYCHEDKKHQSADTQRCTDFINSYAVDNIEDVSLAWRMERQGCGKENGRQYYHATLSIDPDDKRALTITSRELRDMGERFVKEFAPGHSYAVFVHRDEKHPHIHILWNSVNPETGKKFHLDNEGLGRSQEIKNRIDSQFGIEKTELKKPEVQKDRIPDQVKRIIERTETAYIWTEDLKQKIEITKKKSLDMKDFKDRLKETGVEATERGKEGKLTYSFEDMHGKQRKVRQDKLGENYGRDSIEEAIRNNVQREFGKRKASGQLSINSLRDPGHERRTDEMLSGTLQKRPDDIFQAGRNSSADRTKPDIRGPGQIDVLGTGRTEEGLQRVLQTDHAAPFTGRSSQEDHGSDERKNSSRQRSDQYPERSTAEGLEAGRGSEKVPESVQFTDDRCIQQVRGVRSKVREQSHGSSEQTEVDRRKDHKHGTAFEAKTEHAVRGVQHGRNPERPSGSSSSRSGSGTDPVRDICLKTTDNREPDLNSGRERQDLYSRVKKVFERSFEKLEEWRSAIISRIRGTTVERRDRPDKHGEQSRDSGLHEKLPENARSDVDSYGRNSSEGVRKSAHNSSERVREYEDSSSGRTAQYQYYSFRRTGEYSSILSERRGKNQALLQFSVEDTFNKLHKDAGTIKGLCNNIRDEIDRQEHERSQKRIKVKVREKSEEIDF